MKLSPLEEKARSEQFERVKLALKAALGPFARVSVSLFFRNEDGSEFQLVMFEVPERTVPDVTVKVVPQSEPKGLAQMDLPKKPPGRR